MFKKVLDGPETSIKEIAIEVASNIIYLLGIIIIELVLRPLFGSNGVPLIPNIVLMISELALFVKLLWKLFILFDSFMKEIAESWTFTTIKGKLFGNITVQSEFKNQLSQGGDDLAEYKS